MSARPFYEMIYHVEGYTLADAFRPQPGWGTRTFTVKAADLGEHSEHELLAAARNGAPPRYRLTSVTLYPEAGGPQVLWSTPPDPRLRKLAERSNAGVTAPVRTWQHDETGRLTQTAECPGPRWVEVPAGVLVGASNKPNGGA